jgi:hypothetical protein
MEEWNAGILGVKEEKTILIVKKSFKPIIPILHHSNTPFAERSGAKFRHVLEVYFSSNAF